MEERYQREAVPIPFTSLVHDRLVGVMAQGWRDLDWSALGALAAWNAGVEHRLASGEPSE